MGAVYRARDLELDEIVAIKMIRRAMLAVPGTLERFRQEVKLARKVTSAHVARTFDIGEHDGERFLTMELVEGESMAEERLRTGRVPLARALDLAAQICRGLEAAHAAGVVHRDLKPENVLVGRDGVAKITDFGVAVARADVSAHDGLAGTPAYMAPEQVTGDVVDGRADLYALGVMLFEMLAGELPWKGTSAEALAVARVGSRAPDLGARRPDLPREAADLVCALLAPDREARPRSAREVLALVGRIPRGVERPSFPSEPRTYSGARLRGLRTVAVLPLENGGAEADGYLADGVTDDLVDALSTTRGLRVLGRGAAEERARGAARHDPIALGRALGVEAVVLGAVRRDGEVVEVRARVVSTDDGFQVWASRFRHPLGELVAAGPEVARAVASALGVEPRRRAPLARDPLAVDLYLRARQAYGTFALEGVQRALVLLSEALARFPDDPMLLSGYAMARMTDLAMRPGTEEEVRSALGVAERAKRLAPDLAEPHVALANLHLHAGDGVRAARDARLALSRSPSSADAHLVLGRLVLECSRPLDAIPHFEAASAIDPRIKQAAGELARAHALLGAWNESDAAIERSRSDTEEQPYLYWVNRFRFRMWRCAAEGAPEEGMREVVTAARAGASATHRVVLGFSELVVARDPTLYGERFEQAFGGVGSTPRRRAFLLQLRAEMASHLGRDEDVAGAVVASVAAGLTDLAWLERCPMLARVRDDERVGAARLAVASRAEAALSALAEDDADR